MDNTCFVWSAFPTEYITKPLIELGCTKVLDLGCGTGGFAIELAINGKKVKGVDKQKEVIDLANFKKENLNLDKHEYIERVWSSAKELDNNLFLTARWGDNDFLDTFGDHEEHENYLQKLPFSKNLELDFNCEDALKTDLKEFDTIMILNVLHNMERKDGNNLVEKTLKNIPREGRIILCYMGPPSRKTGSVSVEDAKIVFEPCYPTKQHTLESILFKAGFEQEKVSGEIQGNISEYVLSMMYSPWDRYHNPVGELMQCYVGKKVEYKKFSLKFLLEKLD